MSTSRTPSVSFSIHMTWFTWRRRPNAAALKAGNYCTRNEHWEAIFLSYEQTICDSLRINLRKGARWQLGVELNLSTFS